MQKLKNLWNKHPWLPVALAGVGTLLGAIIALVVSEAQNFTSDYRAMLDREVAEVQNGAQQVQESLALLAMVANGEKELSRDIISEFDKNILNLHERSKSLSGLLPEANDEFEAYKKSMLVLSSSVGKLTGPESAKRFVESSANWYYAKQKFDEEIDAARTDFRVIPSKLFH